MFRPTSYETGGFICAALGFVLHLSQSSAVTLNGVVVESSHSDLAGVVFGALAIFCAGRAVWELNRSRIKPDGTKGQHIAAAAAIGCVGLYHLATGSGMV